MNKFEQIRRFISSLEADAQKFYESGNNAAGTRLRKGMMDVKRLAQEVREEVTDIKHEE